VQTPWHYTTLIDALDHWQSFAAGLLALVAAVIVLGVPEFFARRKKRLETDAIRASLTVEMRAFLLVLTDIHRVVRASLTQGQIMSSAALFFATELPKPTVYPAVADRLARLGPLGGDVTAFFADLDRIGAALRVVADRSRGVSLVGDTTLVAERFQRARQSSLALLSKLPPDDGDADLREKIEAIGQRTE